VEARNLGQLSPLYSVALLQASGVLPEGSEGISAYRVDRSPGKPWNDLWGRPLVAAAGIFLPNRSEYLDGRNYSGRQPYAGLSAAIVNQARTLAFGRPRDATLNAAQQAYGFNRAVYLAIGAPGPALSPDAEAALAGTWDDNTERTLLRAIWLQVRDTCAASEWDERGFASPPWSGVRSRRSNGLRSQLSAPLEIK
jgi:hypothetical protein